MKSKDTFSTCHPLVNLIYFAMVIGFSMFFMHPVSLVISLVCAFVYAANMNGGKSLARSLMFMIPMMVMAALLNPVFNHEGATILLYLPTGNPLTLESIAFGMASAVMLGSVMTWFTCFTEVMTADKFVYLFGRVIPSLSLILSMTLRFVPRFKAQMKLVSDSQRCVGRDVSDGSVVSRIRKAVTIISIMVTWSLENALETADSMKSRGYGLEGRTAFSIYKFDKRDGKVTLWLALMCIIILAGAILGVTSWEYYPTFTGEIISPLGAICYIAYTMLCLTPVFVNKLEERYWKEHENE
ncbi:MAG: energy-coupling factor transporter transmembrane protein EcfT [Clostridia bacterium]|nr:energy-coupling factor transporter transmembrane protein EcfT [Clostridia bacterium]